MRYTTIFLIFIISIVQAQFDLEVAFPHLKFTRPVDLQNAGDGSDRIFVVEQRGLIHVFNNDSSALETEIFLDIQNLVNDSGSEQGLLGLTFHPNFTENGYFYVNYTASNPNRTVISRFTLSATDPTVADKGSEFIILEYNQPESNHNGGQLAFGPDGYLYIAVGDGGGTGDQHGEIGNGQDRTTLLGSILRIDVDNMDDGLNYAIPDDNPFVGNQNDYREEIFAYGLRNPWRFSFDKETGWLWAGDVGQGDYEEVNIIESGNNCGWRIMEGLHCYNHPECDTTGLTMPIWEYPHGMGYSITGGHVYYGANVPELKGKYIYADYVTSWIWALTYDGIHEADNGTLAQLQYNVSSFGVDESNELYVCTFNGISSQIYQFTPTITSTFFNNAKNRPFTFQLGDNYPNPFNPTTCIPFSLNSSAEIKITIFDMNGRIIKELVNDTYKPGNHLVYWNGKNQKNQLQSSGIYFYQLTVDSKYKQTKRLVLLK